MSAAALWTFGEISEPPLFIIELEIELAWTMFTSNDIIVTDFRIRMITVGASDLT